MKEFFSNDLFFIYFLAMLTFINYSSLSKFQKISIIYFCTFGISISKTVRFFWLAVFLIITLFIYEEFLNEDKLKTEILYKFYYKLLDFLYMYTFQYKIMWILLGLFFSSTTFYNEFLSILSLNINSVYILYVQFVIALVPTVIGINSLWSDPVRFRNYIDMYNIISKYSYHKIFFSESLKRRMELVADIEDKCFFYRKKGYSFLSLYYVSAWLKINKQKKYYHNNKISMLLRIKKIINKLRLYSHYCFRCLKKHKYVSIIRFVRKIYQKIVYILKCKYIETVNTFVIRVKKTKAFLSRGHSTLGMQLIRIIAYDKGLTIGGKPKTVKALIATMKRKVFEILYCNMFFDGLEHYLSTNLCNPIENYRYYLIYLYLHIAQSKVGKKTYAHLSDIFENTEVETWPIELLFISCLGLNSAPLSIERVLNYLDICLKYDISLTHIEDILESINSYK